MVCLAEEGKKRGLGTGLASVSLSASLEQSMWERCQILLRNCHGAGEKPAREKGVSERFLIIVFAIGHSHTDWGGRRQRNVLKVFLRYVMYVTIEKLVPADMEQLSREECDCIK